MLLFREFFQQNWKITRFDLIWFFENSSLNSSKIFINFRCVYFKRRTKCRNLTRFFSLFILNSVLHHFVFFLHFLLFDREQWSFNGNTFAGQKCIKAPAPLLVSFQHCTFSFGFLSLSRPRGSSDCMKEWPAKLGLVKKTFSALHFAFQ